MVLWCHLTDCKCFLLKYSSKSLYHAVLERHFELEDRVLVFNRVSLVHQFGKRFQRDNFKGYSHVLLDHKCHCQRSIKKFFIILDYSNILTVCLSSGICSDSPLL